MGDTEKTMLREAQVNSYKNIKKHENPKAEKTKFNVQ